MRKSQSSCGVGSADLPSLAWPDSPELESGLDLFDLFLFYFILFHCILFHFSLLSRDKGERGGGGGGGGLGGKHSTWGVSSAALSSLHSWRRQVDQNWKLSLITLSMGSRPSKSHRRLATW